LDTALALRTAAVEGRKQALLASLGICSGCLLWGAAASFGLSALLAVSGFAYNVLRIVGAFYLSFLPQFIPAGVQVWSFSILLALILAIEGLLWFLLLTNATELLSGWLRQRRVVMALDSVMGVIFIRFGLKLAFDKAH
jgi:threonine/homoserine/homoserine lactone efflux protein